jgi:hypothetical protein
MATLESVIRSTMTIPVTIEALPGDCYTIREIATGTELYVQGTEQAETYYGDLAVSTDDKFSLLDLTTLDRGDTWCAWLSGNYADTLRDTATYNALT